MDTCATRPASSTTSTARPGPPAPTRAGPPPTYGSLLRRLIDAENYPALHEVVASGVFDSTGEYTDADFDYGLQRVLDGIEVMVRARA